MLHIANSKININNFLLNKKTSENLSYEYFPFMSTLLMCDIFVTLSYNTKKVLLSKCIL